MKPKVAVVGGGIVGLACAYQAALLGAEVQVFEQNPRAVGASIRNFGMIWPVGQGDATRTIADRSREIWGDLSAKFGFWSDPCGSLHLAHAEDEMQVLEEFQALRPEAKILTREEVIDSYGWVKQRGLVGGLFSPTELCVYSPEAVASVAAGLAGHFGVRFHFEAAVTHFEESSLWASGQKHEFDHAFVCTGHENRALFPEAFDPEKLIKCRLQMFRSKPVAPMGVMACGGLTLAHYAGFDSCPTLPALKERFAKDYPLQNANGIHILISQHVDGRLTLGDSHHYSNDVTPFNSEEVDDLILEYLNTLIDFPLEIDERWQGVYLKRKDEPYLVKEVKEKVTLVNGLGGAGMTLSFGLGEKVVREVLI